MAGLELKSLHKSYGEVEVIKGVDLSIEHGEFVVFVGPSGCGKSTLLRMIAGLEEISGGELFIGDTLCNDVEPRDRGIAMVFQNYALYPHMTVYDNVGFGLKLANTPKDVRDQKIREAAKILQMEHLLERKPGQLSGGAAPARGDRAGHRAQARSVPVRRAAVQSRCGAARRHAHGAFQAARRPWCDHDLRDARPGRGDDAGRQDRRAQWRRGAAGGQPDRALQAAREPVRSRLHRQPQDELCQRDHRVGCTGFGHGDRQGHGGGDGRGRFHRAQGRRYRNPWRAPACAVGGAVRLDRGGRCAWWSGWATRPSST